MDLFRRRPVHWVATPDGRFVLATGRGSLILRPQGDAWSVVRAEDGTTAVLADALDLGYAQGVAEDYARSVGAGALVARDAGWRFLEPTDKQLKMLRFLGIPRGSVADKTRGEVSDLITAARAARDLAGVA